MMPTPLFTPSPADLAGARSSASVILLRDSVAGPELLMLRRAVREGDMRSGVWVFPGGVLDAVDSSATLHQRAAGDDDARASARLGLPSGGLDYSVAALRECYEEVGLLLASGNVAAALAEPDRAQLGTDFVALCERHDLRLQVGELVYFSHWLTPPGLPKRFDTRFYLARAPQGQEAVVDEGEALELAWFTPEAALEAGLKLLPVTRQTLRSLCGHRCVDDALAAAASQPTPICQMPRMGVDAQGPRPVLSSDWAWAEIGRLDPQGRGDVALDLQPLRPVVLSPRVTRITCANGSVMTGPGTNTYLLRSPGSDQVTVLDPGPLDGHTEAHLQAVLAAAAPGRITQIVLTHTHVDHSPATVALQALTSARVLGRVADHPEWQDASFTPHGQPQDGDRLVLGPDCTLRAVHTPGHASNHLCWLLEEEQLLFTGDHVMQGSTVVINPPDGDMTAYFESLRRLLDLDLQWLAPGHGFLMAQPHAEVRRLLAHRQAREDKVLAALQAVVAATAVELVSSVYGDVPVARHGIAARSLTAHLLKLAQQGQAQVDAQGVWRALA